MMKKEIYLTEEEQIQLKEIVRKERTQFHVITRARVLLMLDRTGKTDHVRYKRTAEYAQISVQSVYNMRDEFSQIMTLNHTSPERKEKLLRQLED